MARSCRGAAWSSRLFARVKYRFVERNGMAYVAGQIGTLTGAPAFGTYLSVMPLPD